MLLTPDRLALDYPHARLIAGSDSDWRHWRAHPFKPHIVITGVGPVNGRRIPCALEVDSVLPNAAADTLVRAAQGSRLHRQG